MPSLRPTRSSTTPFRTMEVGEVIVGHLRDFQHGRSWAIVGAGASGRVSFVPRELEPSYGERRPLSWLVMLRAAVR